MLHGGAVIASHGGFRGVRAGLERLGLGFHKETEAWSKFTEARGGRKAE